MNLNLEKNIADLLKLEKEGKNSEATQLLFHQIEDYLKEQDYKSIKEYINYFFTKKFSLNLHLSLLIATFRRKNSIEGRFELYDTTRTLAVEKCISKGLSADKIKTEVDYLLLDLK